MGWNRVRRMGRCGGTALAIALALVVGSATAAWSQVIVSVSNSHITASVGVSGDAENADPEVALAGRFGVARRGSPIPLMVMAASARSQSYVTVRIDGGPPTPGVDATEQTAPGWDLIFGDVGTNALNGGEDDKQDDQGEWVQEPTVVGPNRIVATWATLPGGNDDPRYQIPRIEIALEMTLVHDLVLYRFDVTNRDAMSRTVALRFAQAYDAGSGDVPVQAPGLPLITTETDLRGAQIPAFWRKTWRAAGASDAVGGLLQDALRTVPTAVPLERMVFAREAELVHPLWDFVADPAQDLRGRNAGAAIYFGRASVAPGQTRRYVTAFGVNHATYEIGHQWAVGVNGPLELAYDPAQPPGSELTPNPFTVTGFFQNLNVMAMTDVRATLALPAGLRLAAGETATKALSGGIAPGDEGLFRWQVVAATDGATAVSGRQTYTVSFSANPGGQGASVGRDIDIPALPVQPFGAGLQMISVPYNLVDPTPSGALGLDDLTGFLLRWNPSVGMYERVGLIQPGEGYWLSLHAGARLTVRGGTPVSTGIQQFERRLSRDWNQIGNPWLLPIRWGDVRVINTDRQDPDYLRPLTVAEAAAPHRRWIQPTLWWYDAATGYNFDRQFEFGTEMTPFRGFWVKALKPSISLLFPAPMTRAAASGTRSAARRPDGWSLRVTATSAGVSDAHNYIGMSPNARDGVDARDILKPPAVTGRVSLAFVGPEDGAAYAQDLRAASLARREWRLNVASAQPNQDVTVSWPGMASVPRQWELFISDPATGQRHRMRQVSSLQVRTGTSATRSLSIVAEPRGQGAFRITSAVVVSRARGSATVAFTASQSADVAVRILRGTGDVVRTLVTRAVSAGVEQRMTWDYRDAQGIAIPSGSYLIEVKGVASDGQTDRRLVPHIVVR
ncbi:MAG TPA: FlgD immunoglobulin-like domain containing protein [Chthonomonadales bacterium]|nr:FlgD immunoglobulin-like domain containing protein [Chthonomonadales bacterium]